MKRNIGHAIIGYGFMGKTHAYALHAMPLYYPQAGFAAKPVALCARRMEAVASAAETLHYAYPTDDFSRVLADPAITSISICTPNDSHETYAIAALRAGKHVYLEKPVADSLAPALRIEAAARESGAHVGVVFNNRFFPSVMRARQLVLEGRIGRVIAFRAAYLHSGAVDTALPLGWKHDARICGGGSLLDLGSHVIDLIQHLAGNIESVQALTQTRPMPRQSRAGGSIEAVGEDAVYMLLKLAGGGCGSMEATKVATGMQDELRIEVHGELGALRLNLMDANWLDFYDNTLPEAAFGGDRGWKRIECVQRYEEPSFLPAKNSIGWVRSHVHGLYSFFDAIAGDREPDPGIGAGVRVQRVIDAAYRSAERGSWVAC